MEQGKLIQTVNVIRAQQCIDFLLTRPKQEIVGLGMLYGKPGLGKTTFATRTAFRNGYTYLRLEATSTPKTFAKELLSSLYRNYGYGEYIPHGSTNTLFKQCVQVLCEQQDAVIIIDEIGFTPIKKDQANSFFNLVSEMYEKTSIIFTTNKEIGQWAEVMGDPILTTALLDRILHHSKCFSLRGESYRIKHPQEELQKL